jgi:hypothetical protein
VSEADSAAEPEGANTLLVVDMANVVGSVPDGWWRDRARAAERLLSGLAGLLARTVPDPEAIPVRIAGIVAVLEGRANLAKGPPSRAGDALEIVRATGSGDDAVVQLVEARVAAGDRVLVVSADQGLRARLPEVVASTGPRWLNNLLGRG